MVAKARDKEKPMHYAHFIPVTLLAASTVAAQTPLVAPTFAPPVRLKAGDKFLGENRLFPSPVYHDLNGDGRADIVVGDLQGHLTVAHRAADAASALFASEEKVLGADGEIVDLQNW
jgi:hypothetical protein